jgi:hypothetical protein
MTQQILETTVVLEKYAGKGGWVYFVLPPHTLGPLGKPTRGHWLLSGQLDNLPVEYCTAFSNGKGALFFPVKAAYRKQLGKREGQQLHIRLWPEYRPYPLPPDLAEGLEALPQAQAYFLTLSPANQRYYIDWVGASKHPETRMQRIVSTLLKLEQGKRFHEK